MKLKKSIALVLTIAVMVLGFTNGFFVGALEVNIADCSITDAVAAPSEIFEVEVTVNNSNLSEQSLAAVLFTVSLPDGFSMVEVSDNGTVLGDIDPDTGLPDESVYYTAELSSDKTKVLIYSSDFTTPIDSMTAILKIKACDVSGTYNINIDSIQVAGVGSGAESFDGNFTWSNNEANFSISETSDKIAEVLVHSHSYGEVEYKIESGRCITYKSCSDPANPHTDILGDVENAGVYKAPILKSGLAINFRVTEGVAIGYTDIIADFEKDKYTENVLNEEKVKTTVAATSETVENIRYLTFAYTGIAAKEMCDNINVKIFGIKDGDKILLGTTDFKFADYIKKMCDQIPDDTSNVKNAQLKTLLVDLANYGAAAQKHFGYHTDAVPTVGISQVLASSLPTTFNTNTSNSGIDIYKAPNLGNVISLNWRIKKSTVKNYSDLTLTTSYKNTDGSDATPDIVEQADFEIVSVKGADYYSISFDKMSAARATDIFNVELKSGDQVIATTNYTLEAYVDYFYKNQPETDLCKLCQSIVAYSHAAYNYFN